jgi:SAM-dependent methyltransferase
LLSTAMPEQPLTPAEVAILETFVVPRYLKVFAEAALSVMLVGPEARIAHLGCRTGYPDRELLALGPGCSVVGVDASEPAIHLARNKAATLKRARLEYRIAPTSATELESATFSHVFCLHPSASGRDGLFEEMHRLLYSEGQALVSLPLRGSFQELSDLLREYALKNDQEELGRAVELAATNRPTIESLAEDLESKGFEDVDVDVRQVSLSFQGGRAFSEDPATRLMVLPEQEAYMGPTDFAEPLAYVNDAIGKYWSGREFELSLVIGTATARKA